MAPAHNPPSYGSELLGWGLHEDMETAGTMAVREAHTGAETRTMPVVPSWSLASLYPSELHGVEQLTRLKTACP